MRKRPNGKLSSTLRASGTSQYLVLRAIVSNGIGGILRPTGAAGGALLIQLGEFSAA